MIIFKNQFVPRQPDAVDCNCYSQTTKFSLNTRESHHNNAPADYSPTNVENAILNTCKTQRAQNKWTRPDLNSANVAKKIVIHRDTCDWLKNLRSAFLFLAEIEKRVRKQWKEKLKLRREWENNEKKSKVLLGFKCLHIWWIILGNIDTLCLLFVVDFLCFYT